MESGLATLSTQRVERSHCDSRWGRRDTRRQHGPARGICAVSDRQRCRFPQVGVLGQIGEDWARTPSIWHDNHGWLPPAYDVDRESRPTASWRFDFAVLASAIPPSQWTGRNLRAKTSVARTTQPDPKTRATLFWSAATLYFREGFLSAERFDETSRPIADCPRYRAAEFWHRPEGTARFGIRGCDPWFRHVPIADLQCASTATAWGEAVISVCFADGHVEPFR